MTNVQGPEDELFEHWCKRGDVQALGELFDTAAPQLLKLAIHLAGNAAEAEDLVQATFLAAIEQRATIDATRPAMPWLSGVLAHKARDYRRRSARPLDASQLAARAEGDASQPLQQRELSGELAAAIDRVDEPYRQVLMLRFRHGLEVADIAHVLERSAGTVRVQLHRGIERLRPLVTASIAAHLAFATGQARGLAAIKTAVLREAVLSVGAVATTSAVGGVLVAKKLLAACAIVAVLLVLAVWRARSADAERDVVRGTPADVGPVETSTTAQLALGSNASTESSSTTRSAAEQPAPSISAVRGVVRDGESGEPVARARLRLYAPRSTHYAQLAGEDADYFQPSIDGRLTTRSYGDWPYVAPPSQLARFGRDSVLVYDDRAARGEPLAEAVSASDGTFALPCAAVGGVLTCEHERYGVRSRAAHDPRAPCNFELRPEREIRGRVTDPAGRPLEQPLRIAFSAVRELDDGERSAPGYDFRSTPRVTLGVWAVDTDARGAFAVRVAAPRLLVDAVTPGWILRGNVVDPQSSEPVVLIASRAPLLRFFDAATREPVEHVRLLGRELTNRYVRWSGEFFAPGGLMAIPGDSFFLGSYSRDTLQFTVWSSGYREATLSITDAIGKGTLDVALERGDTPALDGFVLRGGQPVAGARVALIGHSPLQWRADADYLIDAVATGASGAFRLEAPRGTYIVRVTPDDAAFLERIELDEGAWDMRPIAGREPWLETVELPSRAPLVIDLARPAAIEVEIVGSDGAAREAHVVALHGDDGRDLRAESDASGLARFVNLPAGKYTLLAPYVSTRSSFVADEVVKIELAGGEQRLVRIEIPTVLGPRHARVVARGVVNYAGWRARYDGGEWSELAGDGTVPMDLQTAAFALEIAAPDARRWTVDVPKTAPDGYEIRLDRGAARYRGVLIAAATGKPLANVRVHAEPRGKHEDAPSVSGVTDAEGRFEITGLAALPYELFFHSDPEVPRWYDYGSAFKSASFLPEAAASPEPAWLEIRLGATSGTVRLTGRVVRQATGAAVEGAMLRFECSTPATGGTLRLGGDHSIVHTDANGRFELVLPRTRSHEVNVYVPGQNSSALTESFEVFDAAEAPPLEFAVP